MLTLMIESGLEGSREVAAQVAATRESRPRAREVSMNKTEITKLLTVAPARGVSRGGIVQSQNKWGRLRGPISFGESTWSTGIILLTSGLISQKNKALLSYPWVNTTNLGRGVVLSVHASCRSGEAF